jgi:hypothetical protein
MILNARPDQFTFNFPKLFVPEVINKKYSTYLERLPGSLIVKPIDVINYGIQSINLPASSYQPVEQGGKIGRRRTYRTSIHEQELLSKEFTVSFQLLDGFINYWILFDTFNYWYNYKTPDTHLPEGFDIRLTDSEGNIMSTISMKRVLFKEIGALDMSFSNNTSDFSTFSCSFEYNELETKLEIDGI